jgi:hypothetical protein
MIIYSTAKLMLAVLDLFRGCATLAPRPQGKKQNAKREVP